jgi:hypothetical protein
MSTEVSEEHIAYIFRVEERIHQADDMFLDGRVGSRGSAVVGAQCDKLEGPTVLVPQNSCRFTVSFETLPNLEGQVPAFRSR